MLLGTRLMTTRPSYDSDANTQGSTLLHSTPAHGRHGIMSHHLVCAVPPRNSQHSQNTVYRRPLSSAWWQPAGKEEPRGVKKCAMSARGLVVHHVTHRMHSRDQQSTMDQRSAISDGRICTLPAAFSYRSCLIVMSWAHSPYTLSSWSPMVCTLPSCGGRPGGGGGIAAPAAAAARTDGR